MGSVAPGNMHLRNYAEHVPVADNDSAVIQASAVPYRSSSHNGDGLSPGMVPDCADSLFRGIQKGILAEKVGAAIPGHRELGECKQGYPLFKRLVNQGADSGGIGFWTGYPDARNCCSNPQETIIFFFFHNQFFS